MLRTADYTRPLPFNGSNITKLGKNSGTFTNWLLTKPCPRTYVEGPISQYAVNEMVRRPDQPFGGMIGAAA
jgi:hypothetical protein